MLLFVSFALAALIALWLTMPNIAIQNILNDPSDPITGTFLNTLKMRLFKNNLTPGTATVLGDFTEADFTGYSAASLSGFAASSAGGSGAASSGDAKTFTVGSSPTTTNNIYGYYITDSGNTKLYGCQRDPNAPRSMAIAGDTYTVTPTFSGVSQ